MPRFQIINLGKKMKKLILATALSLAALPTFANTHFSTDFVRAEQSKIEFDSGADTDIKSLHLSYTPIDKLVTEAYYWDLDSDDFGSEQSIYGVYIGTAFEIDADSPTDFFAKIGYFKHDITVGDENISDNGFDSQVGLRWNYGLERIEIKTLVGYKKYNDLDFKEAYFGLDAQYYMTQNFAIGVSLTLGEDSEETGVMATYYW